MPPNAIRCLLLPTNEKNCMKQSKQPPISDWLLQPFEKMPLVQSHCRKLCRGPATISGYIKNLKKDSVMVFQKYLKCNLVEHSIIAAGNFHVCRIQPAAINKQQPRGRQHEWECGAEVSNPKSLCI
jgi:hypothetical protein